MALAVKRAATPGPYNQMMRRMTGRMRQLQDEMALESVTNIEFEEASRRSFDFLHAQVQILKGAFNKLTDGLLEELDLMGCKVDQRLEQIAQKKIGVEGSIVRELSEATKRQQSLSNDVDAILSVIPKLEDKIDTIAIDLSQVNQSLNDQVQTKDDLERLQLQVNQIERDFLQRHRQMEMDMKEELDQRTLKIQRNVNRQLETMSKVLADGSPMRSRAVDFDVPASPTFSTTAPNAGSMLSPTGRLSRSQSPMISRSFGAGPGDVSSSLRDAVVGSRLSGLRIS